MNRLARTSTEVLKAAKWILENVGWCKGQYVKRGPEGQILGVCASQAIGYVQSHYTTRDEARKRLEKVIKSEIIAFNDADSRRKRDVIRALDRAIKNEE